MEISSTELEKYRLEIFNLKQKIKLLSLKIHKKGKGSLYKKVPNDVTMLISKELDHDQIECLEITGEGLGLQICFGKSIGNLKSNDKVLEVNGIDVFHVTLERWMNIKRKLKYPVQAVFIRTQVSPDDEKSRISDLNSNITDIQQRLEKKLKEGKVAQKELEIVNKERSSLEKENLRLMHRIAYLEDQTKELRVGMRKVCRR